MKQAWRFPPLLPPARKVVWVRSISGIECRAVISRYGLRRTWTIRGVDRFHCWRRDSKSESGDLWVVAWKPLEPGMQDVDAMIVKLADLLKQATAERSHFYVAQTCTEAMQTIILLNEALLAERERCASILSAARLGEIDGDLRSLIHRIRSGSTEHEE